MAGNFKLNCRGCVRTGSPQTTGNVDHLCYPFAYQAPYEDTKTHGRDSKPDIWQEQLLDEGIAVLRHSVHSKANRHRVAKKKNSIKARAHAPKKHSILQKILPTHKDKKASPKQEIGGSYDGMLRQTPTGMGATQNEQIFQGKMRW